MTAAAVQTAPQSTIAMGIYHAPNKDWEHPFARILLAVYNDLRLGKDELGVLLYLLSKPPTWIPRPAQLCQRFQCSRGVMQGILRRLATYGYAKRVRDHTPDGHLQGSRWTVYEVPLADETPASDVTSDRQPVFPIVGKTAGIVRIENPRNKRRKEREKHTQKRERNNTPAQDNTVLPSDPVAIAESLPTPLPPDAAVIAPGETDTAQPHSTQAPPAITGQPQEPSMSGPSHPIAQPVTEQPQAPTMPGQPHNTVHPVQAQGPGTPPADSPLRDIKRKDLQTAAGILRLFEAFCQQGLPHTEANLHHVLAAGNYALRKAKANAPAYFRVLVERQAWDWIRDQDYEAARRQAAAATQTMPPVGSPVHELLTSLAASQSLGANATADTSTPTQHGHAVTSEAPPVRTYRLFDATAAQHEEQRRLVESQEQSAEQQAFAALSEAEQQQFEAAAAEALTQEGIKPDYCTPFQIRRRALALFEAQQPAREGPPGAQGSPLARDAAERPEESPQEQEPHQHRWKDWGTQATWCWCLGCPTHHPDCQCPMCGGEGPPESEESLE